MPTVKYEHKKKSLSELFSERMEERHIVSMVMNLTYLIPCLKKLVVAAVEPVKV